MLGVLLQVNRHFGLGHTHAADARRPVFRDARR